MSPTGGKQQMLLVALVGDKVSGWLLVTVMGRAVASDTFLLPSCFCDIESPIRMHQ